MTVARIRVADLPAADLPPEVKLHLTELVITEWAIATALIMIHGHAAGMDRYWQMGGHVYPDPLGNPVIRYTEAEARAWLSS